MSKKATVTQDPGLEVVTHFVRPPQGKELHITLVDKDAPTYEFIGDWGGRDIMVVARTIVRAYRKEQLAKRHTTSETNRTSPAIGASNG